MRRSSPSRESEPVPPLLRRADQAVVAVLLAASLVSIIAWWVARGGHRGGLIEIDRVDPLAVKFQVDVNQADWPELSQLPGIGETLARRIVESRHTEGPYRQPEDLKRVRGIGPKTLEGMRPYLLPVEEADLAGSP